MILGLTRLILHLDDIILLSPVLCILLRSWQLFSVSAATSVQNTGEKFLRHDDVVVVIIRRVLLFCFFL